MRTKLISLLAGLGMVAGGQRTCAQSVTHFFNGNQFARTTAVLPNTSNKSVTSETVQLSTGQAIHVTHYAANGTIANSFLIDNPGVDDQNVAIVALRRDVFAIVSNEVNLSTNISAVRLTVADVFGNILNSKRFSCTHTSFNSIYALDMKWDADNNQYVLCGTAFSDLNCEPGDPKDAFVLTVTPSLSPINMRFFISNSGNTANDYDIANRVVLAANGYYITGGINMHKMGVYYKCGMRNMLIDPSTLNYSASFGWSRPLCLQTDYDELSADMTVDPSNGEFIVLAGFAQTTIPLSGIVRVDPTTGNPTVGVVEAMYDTMTYPNSTYSIGHTISPGNNANEVVIHGVQINMTSGLLEPYYAVFDLSTYPAFNTTRYVYESVVGNASSTIAAVSYGDFYATANSYPQTFYRNRFADREGVSTDYSLVAPVFNPSATRLNTKFLATDPDGVNSCPLFKIAGDMQFMDPVLLPPFLEGSDVFIPTSASGVVPTKTYNPLSRQTCANGYYRKAGTQAGPATRAEQGGLSVFPNPAGSTLNIGLRGEVTGGQVTVQLFDMSGKKLATLFDGQPAGANLACPIPAEIGNGLYLLKVVRGDGGTLTRKVTIAR